MQRSFRLPDESFVPGAGMPPGSLLRRLREEPQDAISRIAGEIGPRRATSLGEAQAAAYLDGRMRRAGLRVSADAFRAPVGIGWDGLLIALLGLIGVVLYYWLPIPSLALALWNIGLAAVGWWRPAMPLLQRKRPCQNVIATRALNSSPRWRVVLLAALDSPPATDRWVRVLGTGSQPRLIRLVCCGLIVLLGVGAFFGSIELRRWLWYVQFVGVVALWLVAVCESLVAYAPPTAGAANHAGALAGLLQSADTLGGLEHTELWAVALGATDSGAGLVDFLRRYPFDRNTTLFVGLESLGGGQPSYATREGRLPQRIADSLLLRLVAEADAADPLINAEPRAYTSEPTLIRPLRRAGYRTLALLGLEAEGRPGLRGSPADTPEHIDVQALDRAIRLVNALVKRIDETEHE